MMSCASLVSCLCAELRLSQRSHIEIGPHWHDSFLHRSGARNAWPCSQTSRLRWYNWKLPLQPLTKYICLQAGRGGELGQTTCVALQPNKPASLAKELNGRKVTRRQGGRVAGWLGNGLAGGGGVVAKWQGGSVAMRQ